MLKYTICFIRNHQCCINSVGIFCLTIFLVESQKGKYPTKSGSIHLEIYSQIGMCNDNSSIIMEWLFLQFF